jgi:hypothetical protein
MNQREAGELLAHESRKLSATIKEARCSNDPVIAGYAIALSIFKAKTDLGLFGALIVGPDGRTSKVAKFIGKHSDAFAWTAINSDAGLSRLLFEHVGDVPTFKSVHSKSIKDVVARQAAKFAEEWSELTKSASEKVEHRIVYGQAVKDGYDSIKLDSCMRGETGPKLYAGNPDVVGLVIVTDRRTKVDIGRALLWNTAEGTKVLDRIYPNGHRDVVDYLKDLAGNEGWDYRDSQSMDKRAFTSGKHYTVEVTNVGHWPYMDTFYTADRIGKDRVRLYTNGHGGAYLQSTSDRCPFTGAPADCDDDDNENQVYSDYHEEYIDEDDAVYSEHHGTYLHRDAAVELIGGDYATEDDVIFTTVGRRSEQYAIADDVVETHDGEYIWNRDPDLIQLADGDTYSYRGDDAVVEIIGGQYVLRTDYDAVELIDGRWAVTDDAVELFDGTWAEATDAGVVELHDGTYAHKDYSFLLELFDGTWALPDDVVLVTAGPNAGKYDLASRVSEIDGETFSRGQDDDQLTIEALVDLVA